MATQILDPISIQVPIVDSDGKPTSEFQRWFQKLAISANLTSTNGVIDLAAIAAKTIMANKTVGAAAPTACSISDILDFLGTIAQGSLIYRDATGWALLSPGTAGNVLTTHGASANPTWTAPSGGVIFKYYGMPDIDWVDTTSAGAGNYIGRAIFFPFDCTLTNVVAPAAAASATCKLTPGIYSMNSSGTIGTLVASGAQVTGVTAGMNLLPLTSNYAVTGGTVLYVGFLITTAAFSAATTASRGAVVYASSSLQTPNPSGSYGNTGWDSMFVKLL